LGNPLPLSQIRTALTVALYEWVANDRLPPPSRHPRSSEGGLLRPEQTGFPEIPESFYTASYNPLHLMDYSTIPPTRGEAYTVLVGRVNADGNMIDGVRHPDLQVPTGTHTGWNLRQEGFAEDEQCGGTGSYFPLIETQAERRGSWDPRPSFEERYQTPERYLQLLEQSASQLVEERFLLPRDAETVVQLAREKRLRN
jgi:hypothetical protein